MSAFSLATAGRRPAAPVGAHLVRDAFALVLAAFKGKSFRLPAAAELLSLCVAKEKVTKEKGHPAWRLPGILPAKSVRAGRAFRQGILPWRKGIDILVDARCAACRPPLTAAQGPRVKQRAIVARTFHESHVKSYPLTPTLSPSKAGGEGAKAARLTTVIPAKAGIQRLHGIPKALDPSFRWDDEAGERVVAAGARSQATPLSHSSLLPTHSSLP